MKTRKLYSVRYYELDKVFGKHAGYKGRLLPRVAAQRVARRLRKAGLDVQISPLVVNVTPAQEDYLKRRYP